MAYMMVWDPFERFCVGLAIATMVYCGILYINRGRKREDPKEKAMIYGFAGLLLGYALGRFFYSLGYLFREGVYLNGVFYMNTDVSNIYFELIDTIGSIFILIGAFSLIFGFEIAVKRSKYILSIIQIFFIITILIVPFSLYVILVSIYVVVDSIILIIILLYFTKWTTYEFKAISAIILFGYFLILIGAIISHPESAKFGLTPLSVSPLFILAGSLIFITPMLIDVKYFSRVSLYWLILGISIIGFSIYILILGMILGTALFYSILLLVFSSFLILSFIRAMKLINMSEEVDKEIRQDFLSVFTRKQNITEEEVSVSKEKKICLVCKTSLSDQIFLCAECGAFYCIKCSEALSDLENACWVCSRPFDKSKPTKSFDLEEKEIDIEVPETKKKAD